MSPARLMSGRPVVDLRNTLLFKGILKLLNPLPQRRCSVFDFVMCCGQFQLERCNRDDYAALRPARGRREALAVARSLLRLEAPTTRARPRIFSRVRFS